MSAVQGETVTELAQKFNVGRHVVEYVIRAGRIRPAARVGNTFLFDARGAAAIQRAIARNAERRFATSEQSTETGGDE